MTARQRGAAWLLGALLLGRVLDALDLPFEREHTLEPPPSPAESLSAAVPPAPVPAPTAASIATPDSTAPRRARHGAEPAAPIAVNHASAAELQRLPGVGPVLAARIVAEREARGPFRSPRDLCRVRGIGARTSARLAPHLRFD